MAIIGSIRKRGTLIVVIVGFSLAAFILTGTPGLFQSNPTTVGSFNGSGVSEEEYLYKVQQKKNFISAVNPQAEFDEATENSLKEEAWEDIIREKVYEKQYKLLGIKLSDKEANDLFVGETADNSLKQQFVNQSGQFDPNLVQQYAQQFEADESQIPEENRAEWN